MPSGSGLVPFTDAAGTVSNPNAPDRGEVDTNPSLTAIGGIDLLSGDVGFEFDFVLNRGGG